MPRTFLRPGCGAEGRAGLLALVSLLPAPGCCDLAALLCGPDESEWISVSYARPEDTVRTLLEAIRRDEVRVIVESLAADFRHRHGLPGALEAAIAWQRLKEEVAGLHLLGTARVEGPEVLAPGKVRFWLERRDYRFVVDLVRLPYWAVRFACDGGEQPREGYVRSLTDLIEIEDAGLGEVVVRGTTPQLALPAGASEADLLALEFAYEWKVADLRQVEDREAALP